MGSTYLRKRPGAIRNMTKLITRQYLRTRYWMATAAIVAVLMLCVTVSWSIVNSVETNTHFARAFSQLIESTHYLRSAIAQAMIQDQTSAVDDEAAASDSDDAGKPTSAVTDLALQRAFEELVVTFSAIRASDPDGIDDDDDEGAAEEESESESHWNAIANSLFDDLDAEIARFGLAPGEMPASLAAVWEDEDEDEGAGGDDEGEGAAEAESGEAGEFGETGEIDGDDERELESLIGKVLDLAAPIVAAEDKTTPEVRAAVEALERLLEYQVIPVFHEVAPVIDEELTSGASFILVLVLASAFAIICALIFNEFVIFRPLSASVVASQTEILQERDRAVAAEKAKRSFLAVMSHELRTPMNGIMGFANLLLRSGLNDTQKDYTETIYSSGETLLGLLNDILDISKIESGSLELEKTDFDLNEVVKSVVTLLSPRAYTNRLELSTYIDPSLPRHLNGDAGRIRQILLNLVGNAIKFTPSGAIAIEITARPKCDLDDHCIRLSVTDTGVGIPEEKLDSIFERFVQVDDGSNRKYEGSGLGLAICKQLAALMGGEVGVESTLDQGSTFWVTLQLSDAEPPAEQIAESVTTDIAGRRVLVVDDNALNRRIFKLQLDGFGIDATLVPDARTGLRLLVEARNIGQAFDLAIIDHMMPETDGLALAKMIRADPALKDLKLILSSSSGLTAEQQARVLGFDATCPKPVHQDTVLKTIQKLLAGIAPPSEPAAFSSDEVSDPRIALPAEPAKMAEIDRCKDCAQRILIVEDNTTNLRLAMTILTGAGYSVDAVADGLEAVRAVQALPYDLILMDIRMPVMGGVEATNRIRALELPVADCPIIAMTANAIRGDREEYLAAGMNDYISKPIDIRGLVEKVEEYIGPVRVNSEEDSPGSTDSAKAAKA